MGKIKREDPNAETRAKEQDKDEVKLKPVFGIRPGVYLAYIYLLVIFLVLFFALFYPGLARPGNRVSFDSEPQGAAVRVDGVYLATTPDIVFIPKGARSIEMVLPGFSPYKTEYTFPGQVFTSRFFPPGISIRGELDAADPLEALRLGAAEAAEWSFAGEPNAAWHTPPSLSEAAYRAGPAGADPGVHAETENILASSLRYTVTRAGLRDLIRAEFLAENGGLSPSPLTLVRSAREALALLSENPGSAAWLAALLPEPSSSAVKQSAWYRETVTAAVGIAGNTEPGNGAFEPGGEIAGLAFLGVSGGEFVASGFFPRRIAVGDFRIARSELSRASWETFAREAPEWEESGGEDSPAGSSPGGSGESAGNISYYAAAAYCEWLTGRLPPDMDGWEARLPTEAEWEYAARLAHGEGVSGRTDGSPAPLDMLGGLWEWCADAYAPLDFFPEKAEYLRETAPERSVRGGAWINSADSVSTETRASLPPDTRSPFVGFRPVIARKAPSGEGGIR
ncbi:MAG: SUMF1/EgtB/PvdO family nonheme iron enzyme [Spirochaetaceae bacterium]|jgi:hypothetical protein|nr:SUMF1/EgtB/PvdO family nonheme iron enzyme [Spirochaetaceae bacterium]